MKHGGIGRYLPGIALFFEACRQPKPAMSAMQSEVYGAFRAIDVPEGKASRAAAALASAFDVAFAFDPLFH